MKEEYDRIIRAAMEAHRAHNAMSAIPDTADNARPLEEARKRTLTADRDLSRACEALEAVHDRQTDSWNAAFSLGCARRYVNETIDYIRTNQAMHTREAGQAIQRLMTVCSPLDDVERALNQVMMRGMEQDGVHENQD